MKKILGGGGDGYQFWNIVGYYDWPAKKIYDFKSSKRARKNYYLQEVGNVIFHDI